MEIKFKKYHQYVLGSLKDACWAFFKRNRFLFHLSTLLRSGRSVAYYMFDGNGRAPFPKHALLDLTYSCCLQCIMCPQAEDRKSSCSVIHANAQNLKPLNREEWLDVIVRLAQAGCKGITFSGGEPFLISFLPKLILHARKMNLDVAVLTNGMLVHEKTADFLVDQGVGVVSISLEGPEEIDNHIKGNAEAYGRAIAALNFINAAKKRKNSQLPRLSIVPTLLTSNLSYLHFLPEIASQYNASICVSFLQFFSSDQESVQFPNDKGEARFLPSYLREIDSQDFHVYWLKFMAAAEKRHIAVYIQGAMNPSEIMKWYAGSQYIYSKKCLAPWNFLNIDPYGRMLACMVGTSVGSVRDHSLQELFNGEAYCNFRKELRRKGIFEFCSHCCQLSNPLWSSIPYFQNFERKDRKSRGKDV